MKWIFIAICCTVGSWHLCGQDPGTYLLPDAEIAPSDLDVRYLCRPGVINRSRSRGMEISYTYLRGGEWETAEGDIEPPLSQLQSLQALTFKIKIPVVVRPDLKVLLGYAYLPENYRFSRIGPSYSDILHQMDNITLKSNSFALYATRPIDHKYYAGLRFKMAFNGDYQQWVAPERRYLAYNLTGFLGVKESDDLEWGIGLYYSHNFRNTRLLPILLYNRNFNDRWGLETAFPVVINGRYNLNPKSILLFGSEFNSRNYAIDVDQGFATPTHFHLNHAELRLLLRLERQLVPWVWLNLEGGYQYNFNTGLADKTLEQSSFKIDLENNVFFKVGLFLSPPDKLMK